MRHPFFSLLLIAVIFPLHAQLSVTITGDPFLGVDNTDLTEAGSDHQFNQYIDTDLSAMEFSIDPPNTSYYQVFMRQVNINWGAGMTLFWRRTGNGIRYGAGPHDMATFTGWRSAKTSNEYMMYVRGEYGDIPFQWAVTGISVATPVQEYRVDIVWTITEF